MSEFTDYELRLLKEHDERLIKEARRVVRSIRKGQIKVDKPGPFLIKNLCTFIEELIRMVQENAKE